MTEPIEYPEADANDRSLLLRKELEQEFGACELVRPFHKTCYDPGDRLEYAITGIVPANHGRMVLEVKSFVGGGFAGQVYKVRLVEIEEKDGPIIGLEIGGTYAIKILKPPSAFANWFRNLLYFLGFQSSFSPQVNPAAVRVGVLWQKLIRRAASHRFGDEKAVCDTYATFYDENHHSFGEINEWIDGRIWKFEVDECLFDRWKFQGEPARDHNSAEYVHKKLFMQRLVALLHEMGTPELARQYTWWTCKSQPNALKRVDSRDDEPDCGLTAVDFRAGLTLLPFLPMSPADIWLILRGLARGRFVQFDRSDLSRFKAFIKEREEEFSDLQSGIDELEQQEKTYRASQFDITHHHFRLLTSRALRRSVRDGIITSWKHLGRLDDKGVAKLAAGSWRRFPLLVLISLIPILGHRLIKVWGHEVTREHVRRCLTRVDYLSRALRGSRIQTIIGWLRQGRLSCHRAGRLIDRPVQYLIDCIVLSWLPPKWHRAFTEFSWAWARIRKAFGRGIEFLRDPVYREERLLEQVRMGRDEGMLTPGEADKIIGQIKDPYIQKYLRCLAVHLCTVPITQVVMLLAGAAVTVYCLVYRQLSWVESVGLGTAAAATIQLLPISPGSITRGVFVLFLMIKERDIRNYYIAAPISFIHVIGYLAFPLQMVTHDPALARFLAGRWARNTVHLVPVFGEKGGLLEHAVFDFFFNLPLSIRRGFRTNPKMWWTRTVISSVLVIIVVLGAYARFWESRQPRVELEAARIVSIKPYYHSGAELHWSIRGKRVRFDGFDGPVDYPTRNWDKAVDNGDTVDVVVRKSFFGKEYDGFFIARKGG